MNFKRSKSIEAYIPTASMADIAFLLIIFFMVSSVFPVDKVQVDLPDTKEITNYSEDSAVISISTDQLIDVREDMSKKVSEIYGRDEIVQIRASNGVKQSQEIYKMRAATWDLMDQQQFDSLKNQVREFLKLVDRRREIEGRNIIIVLKADAKVPFFAVDGVVQILQELGGESAQSVAILSQPTG